MNALVVMGVAGCGKSTIAEGIARDLNWTYIDGDTLHPQANIDKMSRGEPLQDEDRWPWLRLVGEALRPDDRVVACSALKRAYRDLIAESAGRAVTFVYLHGSRELIAERMALRERHFMPLSLLDSQFAALEVPGAGEDAITVSIDQPPDRIVADALSQLKARRDG